MPRFAETAGLVEPFARQILHAADAAERRRLTRVALRVRETLKAPVVVADEAAQREFRGSAEARLDFRALDARARRVFGDVRERGRIEGRQLQIVVVVNICGGIKAEPPVHERALRPDFSAARFDRLELHICIGRGASQISWV